jgi:hypothetical protein
MPKISPNRKQEKNDMSEDVKKRFNHKVDHDNKVENSKWNDKVVFN